MASTIGGSDPHHALPSAIIEREERRLRAEARKLLGARLKERTAKEARPRQRNLQKKIEKSPRLRATFLVEAHQYSDGSQAQAEVPKTSDFHVDGSDIGRSSIYLS